MKYLPIILLFYVLSVKGQTPSKHLTTNDTLPVFSLQDQDGKIFSSKEQKSKGILVIFFYAKDNASISTKQVLGFKEHYKEFVDEGATIIGINNGTVESHKAFHKSNSLPFSLLSDKNDVVTNLFGIKTVLGNVNRETYVLDFTGRIVFHLDSYLDGGKHAEEALKYIKSQD